MRSVKQDPLLIHKLKNLLVILKQHYMNKRVNQPLLFRPFLQLLLSILLTCNRDSYINKLMVCNANFNLCKPLSIASSQLGLFPDTSSLSSHHILSPLTIQIHLLELHKDLLSVISVIKRGMLPLSVTTTNLHSPSLLFVPTVILTPRETPDDPFPTGRDKVAPPPYPRNVNLHFPSLGTIPSGISDHNTFSINGRINSIPFHLLLDTGASITAISLTSWHKISHHYTLNKSNLKPIQFAGGAVLNVVGQITCNFQINGSYYPFDTYIIQNLAHSVILGRDFLSCYATAIDFSSYNKPYI